MQQTNRIVGQSSVDSDAISRILILKQFDDILHSTTNCKDTRVEYIFNVFT